MHGLESTSGPDDHASASIEMAWAYTASYGHEHLLDREAAMTLWSRKLDGHTAWKEDHVRREPSPYPSYSPDRCDFALALVTHASGYQLFPISAKNLLPCKSCRFDIRSAAHTAFHLGPVSFAGNQPEIAPPSANPYPSAPEVRLLACTRHPNVPPNHGHCILNGAPRLAIRKSFCEFGARSFPLNRDMGFRVNSNSPLWSRDWRKPSGSHDLRISQNSPLCIRCADV